MASHARACATPGVWLGFCVALAAPTGSASAALGGDVASVEADQAQLQGPRTISVADEFSVHEIQAATGTTVKEYVLNDGRVFAVSWQGPFNPDLRQLLGKRYEAFAAAARGQKTLRPGHGTLRVRTQDMVVEAGGHMRAFFGRAYLPELLPPSLEAAP